MSNKPETVFFFTPSLRVTQHFLWKANERKKLPNGKIVGNDKFQLRGFFDPEDPATAKFVGQCREAFDPSIPADRVTAAILEAFPVNGSLKTPVAGVPETWRRLTANTQFGPVDVIDRHGGTVRESNFFPGVWAIAQVSAFPFEDEKTGAPRLAIRLSSVLLDRTDERLKFGNRPSPKQVFAGIIGGTSTVDPFAKQ